MRHKQFFSKTPLRKVSDFEEVIFSLRLPELTIIEAEMFCKNSSMQGVVKKTINIAKVADLITHPQSHRLCGAKGHSGEAMKLKNLIYK